MTKVGVLGGSTAVQIKLPHPILDEPKVLLFVRDGDTRQFQDLVRDSGIDLIFIQRVCTIKEVQQEVGSKKNVLKKYLNGFDFILIDARINIVKAAKELGGGMHVLMRKRQFPFPVKLSGQNIGQTDIIKNIQSLIVDSAHLLVSGGKDFTLACASTDALTTKESVKNIMQSLFKAVSIILHA